MVLHIPPDSTSFEDLPPNTLFLTPEPKILLSISPAYG